jgi:hypothetical protein
VKLKHHRRQPQRRHPTDPADLVASFTRIVEVVSLRRSEWEHGEIAEDENVGPYQSADPLAPGAVRAAAGQGREDPAGLGEADVGALANGEVTEGLGDDVISLTGLYQAYLRIALVRLHER